MERPAEENEKEPEVSLVMVEGASGWLKQAERKLILMALERELGNKSRAAEVLGVSIRTLRNKCHELGLRQFIYRDPAKKSMTAGGCE